MMIIEGQVIRDYLLNSALPQTEGLRLLVSNRIWYGTAPAPPEYEPCNDGPAIVFNRRGGSQHYSSRILIPSMQYECYAQDDSTAEAVYRVLYEALNDQVGPGIKQSRLEMTGTLLVDPDTGWPYVLCAFQHWLIN